MATATRRRRPVEDDEEPQEETPRRRRRPVDDDEDDQPRRRRRPAAEEDDEEEETPRRRRRPEPEDDDDDVEAAPRSRRRKPADDEDDEDETPRRRRSNTRDDDEEDRPRRRRPSRDEDDEPRGRRGRSSGRRMARGWGGYNKVKSATSDFEKKFKPSSEAQVIALLEPEPFAAFARHWIDLDEGKRAFICLASLEPEDDEDDVVCPLCDVGDKPNGAKAYLNVAVLQEQGKPSHEVWEIGPKISEMLEMIDKSIGKRTKLTDIYIEVSSKGTGLNTKYFLEPVFEEDLDELDLKPLTDKQRDAIELHDDSIYPIPSERELDKIADQIA